MRGPAGRWLATALREPPWQYPLVLAQWLRTGPRAMQALWRQAAPDRIEERLTRVGVPVGVVRGRRDALCPGDWARRLVELPGAAHMTVQTHPGDVAGIVSGLVGGTVGGAVGGPVAT